MKRVVIIGAGGHGREIAEILRHQSQQHNNLSLLGFIDDNCRLHQKVLNGLPVLGGWAWFEGVDRNEVAVICAVGSPRVCQRLAQRAGEIGLAFVNAISPLACVSPYARVGEGVAMYPNTVANTDSLLSDHCIVNVGATISHDTRVGRYSNINPGARLAGNVTIGEGCYIGMGANIIQGISVGDWTIVGAGAVVIRDLPANVTAVGVPATVIKTLCNPPHFRTSHN
jgi:sugar O-acyltransferase (sialic acid O-acetyltransferase NeuD family)